MSAESTMVGVDSLPSSEVFGLRVRLWFWWLRNATKLMLLALVGATAALSLVGRVGTTLSATDDSHPLLLMLLGDNTHILAIAHGRMSFTTFFLVGLARSVVSIPLGYVRGRFLRRLVEKSGFKPRQWPAPLAKMILLKKRIKARSSGRVTLLFDKYMPTWLVLPLAAFSVYNPFKVFPPMMDIAGAREVDWRKLAAVMVVTKASKIYLASKGINVDLLGFALTHV